MQSQYPVVEAVLIATRAMLDLSFSESGYYRCLGFCARSGEKFWGAHSLSDGPQLGKPIRPANVFAQFRPKRGGHRKEYFDHPRIELGVRAALDFLFGMGD